jgi:cystathionine gamma-synthase
VSGTACVHAGLARAGGRPLVPPLEQSTTHAWASLDSPPPVTYARGGGANVEALERRLAALEGGPEAVAFGSGLAAIDALLRTLPAGARVVAGSNAYGGTVRLLRQIHAGRLDVAWADTSNARQVEAALERPADLLLLESPSNPTLAVTDLRRCIRAAHGAGALAVVDNTFLTPLRQRPLELGADAVVHSTTKFLDGHNATLGGAVVFAAGHAGPGHDGSGAWSQRTRWLRRATGTVLAPFEAWLTLQGCKTLHLRTRQQEASAAALARAARAHPAVRRVAYPGLPDHPGHGVHRAQASGDGSILAVDLGSRAAAAAFLAGLRLFTLAENLGATESLATHPLTMTHADVPEGVRRELGITEGLVRLSAGVEETHDLVQDVVAALDAAAAQVPA